MNRSLPFVLILGLVQVLAPVTGCSQIQVCTSAALSQALAAGGQVSFGCDGQIDLTSPLIISKDTELDASGHLVVLSGSGMTNMFQVAPTVRFTLRGMVLVNGVSTNGG